nr:hypothetical protein [Tanacetum cinerariifolium]
NNQKPRSFEKATAPVDAENWISHMEKILRSWVVRMHSRLDWLCTSLRVMHLLGGRPISKPKDRLKREYHSIRQTDTETSTEFMQRFLRHPGFLEAAAGTAEEQAKNFQWGLCKSTLNHLMCIPFTDVAQKSGDRHQPTTQQSSHRNHGHNNDRHGSDRRGGGDNHRSSNNNYSGNNNKSFGNGRDQRNRDQ